MLDVIVVRDEISGDLVEQLGHRRRVHGAHVVDGVVEAAAEKVSPHAVDERLGEPRVVPGGHPGRQRLARAIPLFEVGAVERSGLHQGDRRDVRVLCEAVSDLAEVDDLDALHVPHRLAAVDRVDPVMEERRGEAAEVVLLPLLRLVVVTLGALDLHAQEDARRVAREILRGSLEAERPVHGAVDLVELDGVLVALFGHLCAERHRHGLGHPHLRTADAVLARRRHEVAHHAVPGRARLEACAEPVAEGDAIDDRPLHLAAHEDVVPVVHPVLGVLGRREKRLDGLLPLVGIGAREECGGRLRRRDRADDVDVGAPEKGAVVGARRGRQRRCLPGLAERGVDRLGRERRHGLRSGARGDGFGDRGILCDRCAPAARRQRRQRDHA